MKNTVVTPKLFNDNNSAKPIGVLFILLLLTIQIFDIAHVDNNFILVRKLVYERGQTVAKVNVLLNFNVTNIFCNELNH